MQNLPNVQLFLLALGFSFAHLNSQKKIASVLSLCFYLGKCVSVLFSPSFLLSLALKVISLTTFDATTLIH